MMAKVVGFDLQEDDDTIALGVDFGPYEAHNLPLEEASLEQEDGKFLTHRQAGEYKATSIILFNENSVLDECEIIADNPQLEQVMEAFSREVGISYQEFLETQLVRAMQAGYDLDTEASNVRTL